MTVKKSTPEELNNHRLQAQLSSLVMQVQQLTVALANLNGEASVLQKQNEELKAELKELQELRENSTALLPSTNPELADIPLT